MNELANERNSRKGLREQFLATVSVLALLGLVCGGREARASSDDASPPIVWIEISGQLESVGGGSGIFTAPFLVVTPTPDPFKPVSPLEAQRAPRFSNGFEGNISFEPDGTSWVFSAGVRYGRSNGNKTVHQQTGTQRSIYFTSYSKPVTHPLTNTVAKFADTKVKQSESHLVLDFQAGKDVGLGMFGSKGTSVLSLGVRFAQFSSAATVDIKARPTVGVYNRPGLPANWYVPKYKFHNFFLIGQSSRSFHAIGPSISWNASAPIIGNQDEAEVTLDWGVNAAVLFGRQKAHVHHQTTAQYIHQKTCNYASSACATLYHHPHAPRDSVRSVTVPNLGGFAGISFRYADAKLSLGYRGDFFFGAVDDGIDTRKSETLGFHGPFASVSVGLGG